MRRVLVSLVAVGVAVLVSASASAHVERSSYWPDPAPDTAVRPAAGGKVPKPRSLFPSGASRAGRRAWSAVPAR